MSRIESDLRGFPRWPAGVVHLFSDEDEDYVRERIVRDRRLTQAISRRLSYPSQGLAIVGFRKRNGMFLESTVEYICEFERRTRVTSLEQRLVLTGFYEFEPAVVSDVVAAFSARYQRHVKPGAVPRGTWNQFVTELGNLRPEAAYILENLAESRKPRIESKAEEIISFEQDAVKLALDLSGLGRAMINQRKRPLTDKTESVAPFLASLRSADLREDQIIQHDAEVFGGWARISRMQVGAVVFENNGHHLTVINVNRHKVESTLGVDLLYYVHAYRSFVLVQYKALRSESNGLVYRPTQDGSLREEVERMQSIEKASWDGSANDFRLNSGPCFLKFCHKNSEKPRSQEMLKGYYVPLDYLLSLLQFGELAGPRGGIVVSPDSLGRYLTNTDSVTLVEDGWIGSSGTTTSQLAEVLERELADQKSVIVAVRG